MTPNEILTQLLSNFNSHIKDSIIKFIKDNKGLLESCKETDNYSGYIINGFYGFYIKRYGNGNYHVTYSQYKPGIIIKKKELE